MKIRTRLAKQRKRRQLRTHNRIRKAHLAGRVRLSVFRSNKHIYAQLIDDSTGQTLAAASTNEKDIGGKVGGNKEAAALVGAAIAKRGVEKGVKQVAFDRGMFAYHGRIAALADAAREGGLEF
ncbi:MAG: 50S ribosomal protein L18 [Planctomycetaceae bacterium]|nr:50S ribosomal protein L18 [Planctomycetaceae bacterium]